MSRYYLMKGMYNMSKNILITGAAASGKSRWTVSQFAPCDYVLYLRTGKAVDEDTLKRISFDNNKFGVEWEIMTDVYDNPCAKLGDHKIAIFDCLSTYTSLRVSEMCPNPDELDGDKEREIERAVISDVTAMLDHMKEVDGSIIIITLETGLSVTPGNHAQAAYRSILGRVNQRIANMCDEVYFSASGIQFRIK